VATHAVRHTDYSLETHSFFSHHLGDTLLPLFVIYSRHTTSSLHGDTRRLIRHTDPSRHTGNCCSFFPIRHTDPSRHTGNHLFFAAWRHTQQAFLTHREFICIGDSHPLLFIVVNGDSRLIGNTCRHRQHMPEFFCSFIALATHAFSCCLLR